MRIEAAPQSSRKPPDFPPVHTPVNAYLDIPFYYVTDDKKPPQRWDHPAFVDRIYAETVLTALEESLETGGYGIAHVGIYEPRFARHANGTDILPHRFSNHGLGLAMDFKGVVDIHGRYTPYTKMGETIIQDLIIGPATAAIERAGRKPEIKDELGWLHIGIWRLADKAEQPATRIDIS
jgi:hypothetical protein